MKKMRRIAVMLSAMMTFSAIGAMSASAVYDTEDNVTAGSASVTVAKEDALTTDSGKTANANLYIKPTTKQGNDTYDNTGDNSKYIWNVEVTPQNLTWTVEKLSTNTKTLTWNAENGTYSVNTGANDNNYSLVNESSPASDPTESDRIKTVTFNNKSNFNVTVSGSVASISGETAIPDGLFTVTNPSDAIPYGATTNNTASIAIDVNKVDDNFFNAMTIGKYNLVATANFTLTAGTPYDNTYDGTNGTHIAS